MVDDCPNDRESQTTVICTTVICAIVAAWYIIDIVISICYRRMVGSSCKVLSAFLAAAIGFMLFHAATSQAVEAVAFITVVFGQASAFGCFKYLERHHSSHHNSPAAIPAQLSTSSTPSIVHIVHTDHSVDTVQTVRPSTSSIPSTSFTAPKTAWMETAKALFHKVTDVLTVLVVGVYALVQAKVDVISRNPLLSPTTYGWVAFAFAAFALLTVVVVLPCNPTAGRFVMIVVTGSLTVFSLFVSVTQFVISGQNCGLYTVAGALAAFDVLLGGVMLCIHCYGWYTRGVLGFDRQDIELADAH